MPPGGYSRGLAEPEARSVQEISDRGRRACQRVDDPDHPTGPCRHYQTRFWARVEFLRWDPQHEIDERRLVRPEDFLQTLSWGSAPSAAIILAEGLKAEAERRQG